jgi:hypothetical protein
VLTFAAAVAARRRMPSDRIDPVETELQAMIVEELRRRAETEASARVPSLRP